MVIGFRAIETIVSKNVARFVKAVAA